MSTLSPRSRSSQIKSDSNRRLLPPLTRQKVILRASLFVFIVATVWAWTYIGIDITVFVTGFGDIARLLEYMLPPRFDDFNQALDLTFQTLWMAVLGTFLAVLLSVPLAFAAARNTSPHPVIRVVARGIIVFTRAVPDLVFALIFVRALGIGVLAGVLALGFHSIGMIGKLLADSIESTDPMPQEAVTSTGGRRGQVVMSSLVPQIIPAFIGIVLYRLDINLRSATVLGLVGAGGVGLLLKARLGMLEYGEALGVVVIIIVFITVMEFLSAAVRGLLLGNDNISGVAKAPRFSLGNQVYSLFTRKGSRNARMASSTESGSGQVRQDGLVLPPFDKERSQKLIYSLIFVGLIAVSWFAVEFSPWQFFTSLGEIFSTAGRLLPPDFSEIGSDLVTGMLETIAIALVSTFLGTLLSIPLGLLAARNVTVNRFAYGITRLVLLVIRGIPELIIAVIFVAAIGLGPIAGVFALTVGTAGFFAKLIADTLEEVDRKPREAVFATGATRLQEIASSVIPPTSPTLVSLFLYIFDINLRASTVLGIVGGGGIGFLLFNSIRVLEFQATGAIILTIFVVVYAVELISMYIRKQIQ